jgi:LysM repeat protein
MATMPIVLAGAMTVSLGVAAPIDSAAAASKRPSKARSELSKSLRDILTSAVKPVTITPAILRSTALVPTSYTVAAGDTVSSIAARYRLSTASVLALNGLSWKSLIFPGQVLKLAPASPGAAAPSSSPTSAGGRYTIQKGDTISRIASRFGVSTQALLSANGLGWSSIIYPGQTISVPGAATPALNAQTVAAVTPIAAPSPSAPTAGGASYLVKTGDTISSIAARSGVAVSALLAANGLTASSIIYAGRTLVIPGSATTPTGSGGTPLTDEMAANARVIIQVGQRLGVPDRGIVVALAAAMQESGLRDLDYGDLDSVGIFQQRPSTGWGSASQLLNVEYAARLFYGGPSNPNKGRTRGLLDIAGWQSMTVAQAAQAVQISAYPGAYGTWETSAWSWLAQYR